MATDTDLGLGLRHEDDLPPLRTRRRFARLGHTLVLLVTLLALVAVVGGGVLGVRALTRRLSPGDYPGPGTGSVAVQVRTGDSVSDIGASLVSAQVVKSADAFRRAADGNSRATTIQPGYYRLRSHMTAAAALALLLAPSSRLSSRVTVPEGTSVALTLQRISQGARIPLARLKAAATKPAALNLPAACHGQLEGCLFPATYLFPPGTTATAALSTMVSRFRQAAVDVKLDAGAKALRLTPYQILTVASLLEKEARLEGDFPKVARVVYNRLGKQQPLQFDSTVVYVTGQHNGHLTTAQTRTPSPYNTYLHKGLPPTPIDSPGEVALRAALHPTPGSWIYFVTIDKAGRSAFATTNADRLRNNAIAKRNGVL